MGLDIVILFREEGAEVTADSQDLAVDTAVEDLIRKLGGQLLRQLDGGRRRRRTRPHG